MLKLMEVNEKNKRDLINELKERIGETDTQIINSVSEILKKVKVEKDKALFELTEKFDKVKLSSLKVTDSEIDDCFNKVEQNFIDALEEAKKNITEYHEKQMLFFQLTLPALRQSFPESSVLHLFLHSR